MRRIDMKERKGKQKISRKNNKKKRDFISFENK